MIHDTIEKLVSKSFNGNIKTREYLSDIIRTLLTSNDMLYVYYMLYAINILCMMKVRILKLAI